MAITDTITCSYCGGGASYYCEVCGFAVCSNHNYDGWDCKGACGGSNTMVDHYYATYEACKNPNPIYFNR